MMGIFALLGRGRAGGGGGGVSVLSILFKSTDGSGVCI